MVNHSRSDSVRWGSRPAWGSTCWASPPSGWCRASPWETAGRRTRRGSAWEWCGGQSRRSRRRRCAFAPSAGGSSAWGASRPGSEWWCHRRPHPPPPPTRSSRRRCECGGSRRAAASDRYCGPAGGTPARSTVGRTGAPWPPGPAPRILGLDGNTRSTEPRPSQVVKMDCLGEEAKQDRTFSCSCSSSAWSRREAAASVVAKHKAWWCSGLSVSVQQQQCTNTMAEWHCQCNVPLQWTKQAIGVCVCVMRAAVAPTTIAQLLLLLSELIWREMEAPRAPKVSMWLLVRESGLAGVKKAGQPVIDETVISTSWQRVTASSDDAGSSYVVMTHSLLRWSRPLAFTTWPTYHTTAAADGLESPFIFFVEILGNK